MKRENKNWVEYRKLPNLVEVDFHYSELGPRNIPYWEAMQDVHDTALQALKDSQMQGRNFLLFIHGWSTSGPFRKTSRSVVRRLIRSPIATPFIIRRQCIQHESVFVVCIRPLASQEEAARPRQRIKRN